ncbi:hypothetical protein BOTBODRAFT_108396 [Botryobasidium botryosum FD-172 SS1]|uniref:(2E,6E)-farnesyl diphosphate synthase n=1 Tax=Botryobasidium botryosum (strain FD-172 SS1) TaxID=930990 RepID=A0A067MLD9_BOTB1|nr:hypothetical protein BOTBODRAFT_108396 [Botryobasidium botryosum FD-172 SS1]
MLQSCRVAAHTRLPARVAATNAFRPTRLHHQASATATPVAERAPHISPARALPPSPPLERIPVDPFKLLHNEMAYVRESLMQLLGSSHPTLTEIASYYFQLPGKQLRPLLVLLFSRAVKGVTSGYTEKCFAFENAASKKQELDMPLSSPDVLNDWNPSMPNHSASFSTVFSMPSRAGRPPDSPASLRPYFSSQLSVLPTQLRLAQITEMIHVASLLHDDVIDLSSLRRASASAPFKFGNKLSILAGDFMLGRSSAALARLGDAEVVELIGTVIANLVEGEIMQLREQNESDKASGNAEEFALTPERWTTYLQKSYFKTASLMAKSSRAAVVLGGARPGVPEDEELKDVAYAFSRNLGIAFQLVDDLLDYSTSAELGKPGGGADLKLGLSTAPALFAWEEYPEMGPLIARKFKGDGDVEQARDLVLRSSALDRTRQLAKQYADKALEVLEHIPESDAREGLAVVAGMVIERTR